MQLHCRNGKGEGVPDHAPDRSLHWSRAGRRAIVFPIAIVVLLMYSCEDQGDPTAPLLTHPDLLVHVDSELHQPVPGISMQILQTNMNDTTDAGGNAAFMVPPGTYTLRVFGLNGPGPQFRYRDFTVIITEGTPTQVQLIDCLMCV